MQPIHPKKVLRKAMAPAYHYQHGGQTIGPVSASRLKELAAAGELNRDDRIRRDGTENWEPAHRYKGLFTPAPTESDTLAAAPGPEITPPSPAPEPNEPAASSPPPLPPTAASAALSQTFADRLGKLRPIAERYAHEFELAMEQFLAMFAGSACLVLLMLSTFMTWHIYSIHMAGGVLAGVGDTKKTVGMEISEGKYVCLLAVIGIGFFAASYFVKRLLPIGLLVAGAAGTCSLLLALSFKHQINRDDAESARIAKAMSQNFGTMFGEEGKKGAEESIIPHEKYSAGFGLYLSILTSLIVAPSLVFTALFKPISLAFLQKESIHPFARKHGALLIAQGAAILVGLAAYIMRY